MTTVDKATQTIVSWEKLWKQYKEGTPHASAFRQRLPSTRDRMQKWFQNRMSIKDIQRKGLMKNRHIFGANLDELVRREQTSVSVPIFVSKCIAAIEDGDRLTEDGVYRINGNAAEIQKLRLTIDEGGNYDLKQKKWDVHTLTGSLKLFFRELEKPLVPWTTYKQAVTIFKKNNSQNSDATQEIKEILQKLTKPAFTTLHAVVTHLRKVMVSDNKMKVTSLALVFGPNITWTENENISQQNIGENFMYQSKFLEYLLQNPGVFEH